MRYIKEQLDRLEKKVDLLLGQKYGEISIGDLTVTFTPECTCDKKGESTADHYCLVHDAPFDHRFGGDNK